MANLGAAAMVFGQFVTGDPMSWLRRVGGIALWMFLVTFALVLERE